MQVNDLEVHAPPAALTSPGGTVEQLVNLVARKARIDGSGECLGLQCGLYHARRPHACAASGPQRRERAALAHAPPAACNERSNAPKRSAVTPVRSNFARARAVRTRAHGGVYPPRGPSAQASARRRPRAGAGARARRAQCGDCAGARAWQRRNLRFPFCELRVRQSARAAHPRQGEGSAQLPPANRGH